MLALLTTRCECFGWKTRVNVGDGLRGAYGSAFRDATFGLPLIPSHKGIKKPLFWKN